MVNEVFDPADALTCTGAPGVTVEDVDEQTRLAVDALRRIGWLLERGREPTYRVRAFRNAADLVASLPDGELARRLDEGSLKDLQGVGDATSGVIIEAAQGLTPDYLAKLEAKAGSPLTIGGERLRAELRGDLHMHSNWSDGGSSIEEMVTAARDLGHSYVALTDHSPRLTVASGLSAERLKEQLEVVRELNQRMAPFRILTGIEVDILEDGRLDQSEELLSQLDVVVASVHSKLRMPREEMTRRMITAIANPHTDILGHCTGRLVVGRGRPESEFDPEIVFEACRYFGVAVEVNSRPERLDPPRRLLSQALEAGCDFSIDTDAHAPGQLDWQVYGCARAEECGVPADRVINTMTADQLLDWVS